MKKFIVTAMVFASLLVQAHEATDEEHSELLNSIANRADGTVVVDGETFYIVEQCVGCMDGGSSVYDSHGKPICGYIGIAGTWSQKCLAILNREVNPDEWKSE
jgi:hypothetical protein